MKSNSDWLRKDGLRPLQLLVDQGPFLLASLPDAEPYRRLIQEKLAQQIVLGGAPGWVCATLKGRNLHLGLPPPQELEDTSEESFRLGPDTDWSVLF